MKSSLRESLVTRLLLWVAGVALTTAAVLTALQLASEYRAQLEARQAEGATAIALARDPMSRALWNLDQELLAQFVARLVDSGVIVQAEVVDNRGRILATAARPTRLPADAAPQVFDLLAPDGRQRIGRLQVQESTALVRQQLDTAAWRAAAVELIKLAAVILALSWIFNRLVLRRLRHLDAQVRALAPDDQQTRLNDLATGSSARDEIGNVIGAANQLLEARASLQEAQSQRAHAEAANRAKSEFISRVSHELRTPLNAVLGFAQSLEHSGALPPGRQREDLQRIGQAGWHLAQLINDLLDLSRIEAGGLQLKLVAVALGACLEQAVAMVRNDAASAAVAIEVKGGAGLHVRADALRLRQVLVNVLSNAVKYNRSGGRVRVLAGPLPEGRVGVTIEDTGIGMSESDLTQLFQPFNRLGRESGSRPGTGIGLVITKGLVEIMGGSLLVQSRSGEGSTFRIELPAAEPAEPLRSTMLAAAPAPGQRQQRVLYVEDEPVNVEVMRALIGQRPHLVMDTVPSLAQALQAVQRLRPDLVLLDMRLPDGTGLDFLDHLRREGLERAMPVLVISADASDEVVSLALRKGAAAFIAKPIDFAAALAEIDAQLRDDAA